MKDNWDPDDADYPAIFKPAIEAIEREIREKRTYVRVEPKGDTTEALAEALSLGRFLNDEIAENPGAKAAFDQAMADTRERMKRLLLYGHS